MIFYVTGTLGMGKSMYGARSIGRSLLKGKVVACNVRLLDGWEDTVLAHNPYYRFGSKSTKRELRDSLLRRFIYEEDIDRLIRAKIHGRGEARGLMVLDEAHSNFNNRSWANEMQRDGLKQMAMARHRGWEVYVISQHKDNTDAAIRRIAQAEIQMTNWQKVTRVPILGTPMLPVPVFLALGFRLNVAKGVVKTVGKPFMRTLFTAGWFRNLYDTFEEYEDDSGAEIIWLPLPEGTRYEDVKRPDAGSGLLLPGEEGFATPERRPLPDSRPLPDPRQPLPSGEYRTTNSRPRSAKSAIEDRQ